MKRGEIWIGAAPGDYTGKPRPLLIVRDDRFAHLNSVTVCPITSTIMAEITLRPTINAHPENGLKQNSQIMIDKVTTIQKHKISQYLGNINANEMLQVMVLLKLYLGMTEI